MFVRASSLRRSLAVAAFAALAPAALAAQTPLNVSVTVNTALSISVSQALLFGTLTPGGSRTIPATDEANAGIYLVTGTAGANVSLSVVFPSCLRTSVGSCTATDPVIDNNSAHWAQALASTHTALVGAGTLTGTGTISSSGQLFVFVGSRVQIPATTVAGTYTGVVTMTANY
jgi:spore coat protein U-like protein